jgi:hypothetical protein
MGLEKAEVANCEEREDGQMEESKDKGEHSGRERN